MTEYHALAAQTLQEWQGVTDLIARLAGVRVGLIMRVIDAEIEVLVASKTAGNPYHVGAREHLFGSGLYCETVINTQEQLLVANALKSDTWRDNPDLKYGLVSYLGVPIRAPDGSPFGTLCLLDDKENAFSTELQMLMGRMRDLIEGQLRLAEDNRVQRLFAKESLVRRILDNIPMAVAFTTCEAEYKALYLNEQFVRLFGYNRDELPTLDRWFTLAYPDEQYRANRHRDWQSVLAATRRQPGWLDQSEVAVTCKQGRVLDVLFGAVLVDDLLVISCVDITELKRREQELAQSRDTIIAVNRELEHLATTDALTGTSNRRHFNEILSLQIAQARRHGVPLSLLLLDVDHFKSINDNHGHQRGDQVLIEFGERLQRNLRTGDRLARWGGEEFVVLLPYCDASAALKRAEALRALIAAEPFTGVGRLTTSIGVAELEPEETVEQWFKRVDEALYEAKSAGRNAVRLVGRAQEVDITRARQNDTHASFSQTSMSGPRSTPSRILVS